MKISSSAVQEGSLVNQKFRCVFIMWDKPGQLNEFLQHVHLSQDIYAAMRRDDVSEVVMVFLEALRKTTTIPQIPKAPKTEANSDLFRKLGNDELRRKDYHNTMVCYNQALLFAPTNSRAMKLAYSNRSALLFSMKLFSAALLDIDTVFEMGCPDDIIEKLKKRKTDCSERIWEEKMFEYFRSTYADGYFNFNVERNSEIPCASKSVGVCMDGPVPRVLAFKDIEVGELVAVETPFVSETDKNNVFYSCYYCHKMCVNLKPCDKCCFALFCSAHCKSKCMEEYHSIECQIMEVLDKVSLGTKLIGLGLKAVIKMWSLTKDWSKIIKASEEMGRKGYEKNSTNGIFDAKHAFSLLNFDEEQYLNYGRMYNYGLHCAIVINYLSNVHSFLPKSHGEKKRALQAVARIMLGVRLFVTHTKILESVEEVHSSAIALHEHFNHGYFAFTGKLKHACHPNLMIVGLNKKIALIAIKPIKKNTELTVSYVLHWLENNIHPDHRMGVLYAEFNILCGCLVCKHFGGKNEKYSLTDAQRTCFYKLKISQISKEINSSSSGAEKQEKRLSRALAVLSDVPGSTEYDLVFTLFKRCMQYGQLALTRNRTLM